MTLALVQPLQRGVVTPDQGFTPLLPMCQIPLIAQRVAHRFISRGKRCSGPSPPAYYIVGVGFIFGSVGP